MSILRDVSRGKWDVHLKPYPLFQKFIHQAIHHPDLTCINIQKVSDYLYCGTDQEVFMPDDFPTIAPPFPVMWMEHVPSLENYITRDKTAYQSVMGNGPRHTRYAIITVGAKTPPVEIPFPKGWGEPGKTFTLGWQLTSLVLMVESGRPGMLPWFTNELVDVNGRQCAEIFTTDMNDPVLVAKLKAVGERWGEASSAVIPALLSISFMHCKNVHVENDKASFAERHGAKRNTTKFIWKTIEIEPFKKAARAANGGSEPTGIKQALHICRGHFKDYRESGLFGKVKGVFWWDMNLRGSAQEGRVIKDYEIKLPTPMGNSDG